MDNFWIKLVVLAILAGVFVVTVWITPWLFARRPNDPAGPALDRKARDGDS